MAFDPNLYTININPDPANVVLGTTSDVTITATNSNPTDWGYNLTFEMTIPDGVSFVSADIPPTSQVLNVDSTITLTWVSVTDLAPNQIYDFNVQLMSDETYRATLLPVPFNTSLTPVEVDGTVDTEPRGSAEPGNISYTKSDTSSVVPVQYAISKSVPEKSPKGASTPPPNDYIYSHEIVIENNTRQASDVDIVDIMDNGLRYVGPISASGPDAAQLLAPTITTPMPGGDDFVTIEWNSINLSAGSVNTINYDVAIWDNYTVGGIENSGSRILHQTPLNNAVTMTGLPGPVVSDSGTTLALDLMILKSQSPTDLGVGTIITYTLEYFVNQYDDVDGVIITDVIGDGETYQSSSVLPVNPPVKNPVTGETTVVWDLGNLSTSTTGTITFTTVVDANYTELPAGPVLAGDTLTNQVSIDGTNANFATPTPDSSGSSGTVSTPSITKQLDQIYYRDGTPKPLGITAIAPGDLVEFTLNYDYTGTADQKDIFIQDYFPAELDPTTIVDEVYAPFLPTSGPDLLGGNGVEWYLQPFTGGMTSWSANFKISMSYTDFVGSDTNLAKFKGISTEGIVYSGRDQIDLEFGQTNMELTKNVSGPSPNAILSGQTYTYTVVIGNPQNVEGTIVDAFDVDFSDIIPNLLTYTPLSLNAIASGGSPDFDPPTFTGPNLIEMHINQLKPDDEITLTYDVTVDAGIGPNVELTNDANTTAPYSQVFDILEPNYQYPDQERSASQTLRSAEATLLKEVDDNDVIVGDVVNYTITWTVPLGLTAYNVVISDILPAGQVYDNNPSPVPPASVIGNVITWPAIPVVDATLSEQTLIYSFSALIDSSTASAPTYTEVQTNTARVAWEISPGGDTVEIEGTVDVTVSNPNVVTTKAERNVSRGEVAFVTSTNGQAGETIEYRVTVTSDGAVDAYDIISIDQPLGLSAGTALVPLSIVAPPGTTANYNIGNQYVVWNIPVLPVSTSLDLFFRVRLSGSVTPGDILTNINQVESFSNANMTFLYPSVDSNEVTILIDPGVRGDSLEELDNIEIKELKKENIFQRLLKKLFRLKK